jgi:hypothetical protein
MAPGGRLADALAATALSAGGATLADADGGEAVLVFVRAADGG